MSQPLFINLQSTQTVGALGGLSRSIVIASREAVGGSFTPDAASGLRKINSTDVAAFTTANIAASPALVNAITTVFAGSRKPGFVYILSTGGGALTSAMLNKANIRPRDWSFITLASLSQGISDQATYLSDAATIGTWIQTVQGKIFAFTFSIAAGNVVTNIPATLLKGGALNSNNLVKTIISDSKHVFDDYDPYSEIEDNIVLQWFAFTLYGGVVARSMGSLSDAHDFPYVSGDTYSSTERSFIAAQLLGQYNGAKDLGGSNFVYDTFMNDKNDPPQSKQIESQIAIDFINDYVPVNIRNKFQAAGQNGLPADDSGIQQFSAAVDNFLKDCWQLGAILSSKGSPDYTLVTLTAEQVTQLSPTWQITGEWPAGVVTATIRPFAATHYVTLVFTYL